MRLLPLVLGCWAFAAQPEPSGTLAAQALLDRLMTSRMQTAIKDGETETAEYLVKTAARGMLVNLLPDGPRTIRSHKVVPTPATAEALRRTRLRLTWENDDPDSSRAGLGLPLGLAFGRAEGPPAIESLPDGTTDGTWFNRFPMPYRDRALRRLDTRTPLDGQIRVRTSRGPETDAGFFQGGLWSSAGFFQVALWSSPGRLVDSGRGQLARRFRLSKVKTLTAPEVPRLNGKPAGVIPSAFGIVNPRVGRGMVQGLLSAGLGSGRGSTDLPRDRWRVADPIAFRDGCVIETSLTVVQCHA